MEHVFAVFYWNLIGSFKELQIRVLAFASSGANIYRKPLLIKKHFRSGKNQAAAFIREYGIYFRNHTSIWHIFEIYFEIILDSGTEKLNYLLLIAWNIKIRTVRTGTILKGSLRNRISPSWSMGSQKKTGKVPDRCKLQSLHTVSKTVPWMKQAPRTSSGGEIYKLGHRIMILKKTSAVNISQESSN